jgi:hypothetical protein
VPPGQALATWLHQVDGGRAHQHNTTGSVAFAPSAIDFATQYLEQIGRSVDLVEDASMQIYMCVDCTTSICR